MIVVNKVLGAEAVIAIKRRLRNPYSHTDWSWYWGRRVAWMYEGILEEKYFNVEEMNWNLNVLRVLYRRVEEMNDSLSSYLEKDTKAEAIYISLISSNRGGK
jgi:hypothetical protein